MSAQDEEERIPKAPERSGVLFLAARRPRMGAFIMKFSFLKRWWFWMLVVLVAGGGIAAWARRGKAPKLQTAAVTRQDLRATVLATGQVTSTVDLSLAFQTSGLVREVDVAEGDRVKKGQTLAVIDQASAHAALTTAQGALAQAQANEEKVRQGSTSEQIAVAQKAVDAANVTLQNAQDNLAAVQAQQDTAVANAQAALMNTTFTAVPGTANADGAAITVSGTYAGTAQGTYDVVLYQTGNGIQFNATGLETANGFVSTQPVALGTHGLFIKFSTSSPSSNDTWTIAVPNTTDASYVTNRNAYDAAQKTRDTQVAAAQASVNAAQASRAQAQASLAQAQAAPTQADLAAAAAAVLSAQGQVETAQSALDNTVLASPADGTITSVSVKAGEQATALQEAMVLQDVGDLYAEAQVSEADIASLAVGQSVDDTFDALGPDRHFSGVVTSINPASTVIAGVVDYKVKASIEGAPDIKPGMTANLTVLTAERSQVLAVPSAAVIDRNGSQVVRVVDDAARGAYHEVPVTVGLMADDGLDEIVRGLSEGQTVVVAID